MFAQAEGLGRGCLRVRDGARVPAQVREEEEHVREGREGQRAAGVLQPGLGRPMLALTPGSSLKNITTYLPSYLMSF